MNIREPLDMENRKLLIGTSGWSYEEWIGPFYPKGITNKDFLHYYSEIFFTNEINTTFYQIPPRSIVEGWVNKTPSNFVFSAKLPKIITHEYKLDIEYCLDDLEYYLMAMEPLIQHKKLLAFLIQLPPSFTKHQHFDNLKEFHNNWPENYSERGYHLVVEFRNKSWIDEDVFNYLERNNLTYCSVIEPLLPPRMDITTKDFAYVRFHGYGERIWFDYLFSEEEIKRWSKKIRDIMPKTDKIGIYFNNHFSGYAAKNAFMMMNNMGIKPRNRPQDVKILDIKKRSGTMSKKQSGLDEFI